MVPKCVEPLVMRLAEYVQNPAEFGHNEVPSTQPLQLSTPYGCGAQHDARMPHGLFKDSRASLRNSLQQVRIAGFLLREVARQRKRHDS